MKMMMTVLYGSETGTAEDTADRIRRGALRRHVTVSVQSLDEYQRACLVSERLVVFVVSTTGQGDPPKNMKKFWNFIWRKNLPTNSLTNVKFALLGFGDSSYFKFNFIAKKLQKRLIQLGAQEIIPLGLADDQHDYGATAVVDPWLDQLWLKVLDIHPLLIGQEIVPDSTLLPSQYVVRVYDNNIASTSHSISSPNIVPLSELTGPRCEGSGPPCETRPFHAVVIGNERVTAADHWQDVRLITFDIENSNIKYSPGDVLMVHARNALDTVTDFLHLLNLDPLKQFTLYKKNSVSSSSMVEEQLGAEEQRERGGVAGLTRVGGELWTMQSLVESYLDINSVPQRRYFWELLAHFTDSELEREKLTEFISSQQGQEELFAYCTRPCRTVLEVLQDFPHATSRIPFEYLFEMIGQLRPRPFSIASSQLLVGNKVQLLVAVVTYKTRLVRPRHGVCSTFLASLQPGDDVKVPVWVERGTISFPITHDSSRQQQQQQRVQNGIDASHAHTDSLNDPSNSSPSPHRTIEPPPPPPQPLIMVGPGTGCAPFRSCIQERSALNIAESYLFFGCRNAAKDFYCSEEWAKLESAGLLRLYVAFSRDQPDKIYVQHILARQSALIWKLINEQHAFFYIAGNAKNMPDSVREALKNCIKAEGKRSEEEAEAYLTELIKTKRFQSETWS